MLYCSQPGGGHPGFISAQSTCVALISPSFCALWLKKTLRCVGNFGHPANILHHPDDVSLPKQMHSGENALIPFSQV